MKNFPRIDITNEIASSIRKLNSLFLISTEDESVRAKAVILSTDLPELKYTIEGERKFENKGVSYCAVCDGALFRGKKTCIIGEDNFAARGALFLRKFCRKVTILCPSSTLSIDNRFLRKLKASPNVKIKYNVDLTKTEILGNQFVQAIKFVENGEEKELSVNAVFIEMKDKPNLSILKDLDVETNEEGFIITNADKLTNIPGFFAAGVITGEMDYTAILMGDGYKAGVKAAEYLEQL
ncbi:MAG: NAD(P)/FAD-dependent oxidoreductase [Candidatus Heimdallarchaeaceae archaeon]